MQNLGFTSRLSSMVIVSNLTLLFIGMVKGMGFRSTGVHDAESNYTPQSE